MIVLPGVLHIVPPEGQMPYRPKFDAQAVRPSGLTITSCGPRPTGSFASVWRRLGMMPRQPRAAISWVRFALTLIAWRR